MQIGYFVISGNNCFEPACSFIKYEYKIQYEKPLHSGILYCTEQFSVAANNDLLLVITVERVEDRDNEIQLEIIAGGGGSGMFNVTWGNEERRVHKFYNNMAGFCESAGYDISALAEK
ncbi:MAG TPA: hypothetical protein VG738_14345 [Chitinophagaceae bacterium]|nr:hypothetical protein [Chitinophagaceae bacterium]